MPLTERAEALVNPNFGLSAKAEYTYSLPVFGKRARLDLSAFALRTDPTRLNEGKRPYIVPSTQIGARANIRMNFGFGNTRINVGRTHHRGTVSRTRRYIIMPWEREKRS